MTLKSEIYEVTTDDDGNWYELRKRELHIKRVPKWDEYDGVINDFDLYIYDKNSASRISFP